MAERRWPVTTVRYPINSIVYSAVIPGYRGMVIELRINADYNIRYQVAWEDGRKTVVHMMELQDQPLLEEGMGDDFTLGGEEDWN